ncbi:MAG: hypothetical protein ACM3Q2_16595, partial [Syntrophothermus sp.]
MLEKLYNILLDPFPLRTLSKAVIRKMKLGSYEWRVQAGAVDRPHYGFILYNAAVLGKKLGVKRISVLEFGVAGGNGILNLEYHAEEISKLTGIGIEIYGFDTGEGLPSPVDFRDLPYHWKEGFYKMEYSRLSPLLKRTRLVLGDLKDTSKDFFEKYNPAPIGAVIYDLDFYSSTVTALKMLEAGEQFYLPRVFCYFDDINGSELELYSSYTGERLAIREFNAEHDS